MAIVSKFFTLIALGVIASTTANASYVANDPVNKTDPNGEQVFPRDDGSKTVIVYPQRTADHVDRRHSPNSAGPQNKFTQTLGHEKGKIMAMRGIETAVRTDSVAEQGDRTVYEGKIGGFFTNVGTQGEDTVRVVTQDLQTILDPRMLESVADEMADPATVAMIGALEAANPENSEPINVEVIVTQYPVHERDRITE